MNLNFERSENTTVEWYTPKEIIQALGEFDLDPCTSEAAYKLNHSAKHYFTKEDDGLSKEWFGRIWLNPPYSQPLISKFIRKMSDYNNGIALLYNRCDNRMFHDIIFPKADSIFFLKGRIKFFRETGLIGSQPGCGSILVAYGIENTKAVIKSKIEGTLLKRIM